ncbi:MAG: winged helix-turn-helix domain-containing protein [bacterium]
MSSVIIISSSKSRADGLADALRLGGMEPETACSADSAARMLPPGSKVVVLADVSGNGNGYAETLKDTRSAVGPESQIVAMVKTRQLGGGIDGLADDFVLDSAPKAELRERLRRRIASLERNGENLIRIADLAVDLERYEARVSGRTLNLTFKEFELLRFLAENPGRVYSRQFLLKKIWEYDWYGGMRTVDVHVRRLRAKLGDDLGDLITTVRGVGYGIKPPEKKSGKTRNPKRTIEKRRKTK